MKANGCVEVDKEGFSPVKGAKRKKNSPEAKEAKRNRKFSPEKAGRDIEFAIKLGGRVQISESSTSDESNVESLEEEEAGNVDRKAEDTEAVVAIQGEVSHASSHDE